jgi:hypothetical protein
MGQQYVGIDLHKRRSVIVRWEKPASAVLPSASATGVGAITSVATTGTAYTPSWGRTERRGK